MEIVMVIWGGVSVGSRGNASGQVIRGHSLPLKLNSIGQYATLTLHRV